MLSYYHWLAGLALLFIALERIWPRVTGQRIFRHSWLSDVAYFVFNSKYLGILLGYITVRWVGPLDAVFGCRRLASWPWWAQFGALLISIDFLKWAIHNLLHRVAWLWEFTKCITALSRWIGSAISLVRGSRL